MYLILCCSVQRRCPVLQAALIVIVIMIFGLGWVGSILTGRVRVSYRKWKNICGAPYNFIKKLHTLTVVDGFSPSESVVETVAGRCRRGRRRVPQPDRYSHELNVTLGVVPDQEFDARPQVTARLVVDLAVRLDRDQVLLERVTRTVDVRHPVTAGASTVDEVAQSAVFKYLHTTTIIIIIINEFHRDASLKENFRAAAYSSAMNIGVSNSYNKQPISCDRQLASVEKYPGGCQEDFFLENVQEKWSGSPCMITSHHV